MNVLFLDIDGVLKPFETYYPEQGIDHKFEKSCVDYLNKALKNIDVEIVICSMWRLDFDDPLKKLNEIFEDNHIENPIYDITPLINGFCKGKEILEWMSFYPTVNFKYLVVDDDCFKKFFDEIPPENKISPNSDFGLTELECNKIIEFFKK